MSNLIIEKLLTIDNTGMPKAPSIRQIQDKDVLQLYTRDKSTDKKQYIAEVGVIYYLGDPQSPANQQGLTKTEALKAAIENYDLPKEYKPDSLVLRLIDKYYYGCVGEAGMALEAILKSIHLVSVAAVKINELLNKKLNGALGDEEIQSVLDLMDSVSAKASKMPTLISSLKQAYENVRNEKEETIGRGGVTITSSMDADDI